MMLHFSDLHLFFRSVSIHVSFTRISATPTPAPPHPQQLCFTSFPAPELLMYTASQPTTLYLPIIAELYLLTTSHLETF